MLLEFSCSNHKSIKNKIMFSMIAGKDDTDEDTLFEYGNNKVLNSAIIYGANGSGKSNFVDAISFMKTMVIDSLNYQPGKPLRQETHKLLSLNDDSVYFMQFITKGIRYAFGFTLNKCLIKEEFLYVFPNGRQQKIYERQEENIFPGDKYKNKFELCKSALKPNKLLLSCAANFSQIVDIMNVFNFFRDELVVYSNEHMSNSWMGYSLKTIQANSKVKQNVLKLLKYFGTGIKDLNINIKGTQLKENDLPTFLSDQDKLEIIKQNTTLINAQVMYDQFSVDLLKEESKGIKKLIEFVCPFIEIILKGKVLICDEIETSLHESIVYKMFEFFKTTKMISDEFPQIISTTHDTSLLKLDLFRRDQIWFTELKKTDRSTDLYSLAEIKNVRKDENILKGYISGKYGAIPMLNESMESLAKE
ncbi:MAG: ATP-binding protein [Bacilli bacterium]|nr:ATP-binding protein [Bacilli bacterium]